MRRSHNDHSSTTCTRSSRADKASTDVWWDTLSRFRKTAPTSSSTPTRSSEMLSLRTICPLAKRVLRRLSIQASVKLHPTSRFTHSKCCPARHMSLEHESVHDTSVHLFTVVAMIAYPVICRSKGRLKPQAKWSQHQSVTIQTKLLSSNICSAELS